LLPFYLPWLDRCRDKSSPYRSWLFKTALGLFAITFVMLVFLGQQPPTGVLRTL
jgi:ubiquinol-cytochrome c reductase cytochrome b subunit